MSPRILLKFIGLLALAGVLFYLGKLDQLSTQKPLQLGQADSFKVIYYDKKASDEYVLINIQPSLSTQLISKSGQIFHQWTNPVVRITSKLNPQGHLVVLHARSRKSSISVPAQIVQYNKNDQPIWKIEDWGLHHDIAPDQHQGVYAIKYKPLTENESQQHLPWINFKIEKPVCDEFVYYNNQGLLNWKFNVLDHISLEQFKNIIPKGDRPSPVDDLLDVCHFNSIHYYQSNPISKNPSLVVTSKNLNTIFLIDITDSKIIWSSQLEDLNRPHDGRLTTNGTLTVFNNYKDQGDHFNGSNIKFFKLPNRKSQVLFDNRQNPDSYPFGSTIRAGALLQKNQNILITLSDSSQVREYSSQGDLVWRLNVFPTYNIQSLGGDIFKAESYSKDELLQMGFSL